jgi:hypothetical protein
MKRRRQAGHSIYIGVQLQKRVRERFANCCAYCRTAENLTVSIFEFEHIVPRSAGGKTVFENLCLSCPTCNRFKADRQMVPDSATGEDVPLFHPQRDKWTDHFAWNESATEIMGLTPSGRATIAALKMNRPQLVRVRCMWVAMGEHPSDTQ